MYKCRKLPMQQLGAKLLRALTVIKSKKYDVQRAANKASWLMAWDGYTCSHPLCVM